jgi:hypothetical protein
MATRGTVTVRGPDFTRAPLLVSDQAQTLEFRNADGELFALVFRVLADDMWGMVTRESDDWIATLVRFGYARPDGALQNIIRDGIDNVTLVTR